MRGETWTNKSPKFVTPVTLTLREHEESGTDGKKGERWKDGEKGKETRIESGGLMEAEREMKGGQSCGVRGS